MGNDLSGDVLQLRRALRELLEAVESLDDYKLSRDMPPHEAEIIWEGALEEAARALEETEL